MASIFSKKIPLYAAISTLLLISGAAAFFIWQANVSAIRVYTVPAGTLSLPEMKYGSWPALSDPDFFARVKGEMISQRADFVLADLSAMEISVYKGGEEYKKFPILTKGREGSWWETPAGLYRIESKAENHFSSFGQVYQPWSMAFQGNFFIHGWPYYPDGRPVASSFSGGCIRLKDESAKEIFDSVKVGTPVLVYQKSFSPDDFSYSVNPALNVPSFLAADLGNNFVFFEKFSEDQIPIASITKLMTALIAAEYINLDAQITVPPQAIVSTTVARLNQGQEVRAYDLLFPLLQESSNEAAEALASRLGRSRFVSLMNEKAKALGMSKTKFTDPSGKDAGNVSSAQDLFALLKYLYYNRSFVLDLTAGRVTNLAYGDQEFEDVKNFNLFSEEEGFKGGKIGKTIAAKETMVSVFEINLHGAKRPVALIVLGSSEVGGDMNTLRSQVEYRFK